MTTTYTDQPGELDRRIEARGAADGFLAAEWGDDGGVWGCLGHVDPQRFLDQVCWQHLVVCGDTSYVDGVTVDRVAHCYTLRWPTSTARSGTRGDCPSTATPSTPARSSPRTPAPSGVTMLVV
jgi:hypothetical protein